MTLTLSTGSTLFRDDTGWYVIGVDGAQTPASTPTKATLVLLEQEPSDALFQELDGFPFGPLVEMAQASKHPRYVAGALKWARAISRRR